MIWHNSIDNDGYILIESSVLKLVREYCQHQVNIPESGGILLGYRRGGHLHIVTATTPQPDDQRMRFSFFRRDQNHRKAAIRHWNNSGNTMDYIGEWHTHPEPDPSPSSLDISEWTRICSARKTSMIFLIVGWTGNFWLGVGSDQNIMQATEASIEDS